MFHRLLRAAALACALIAAPIAALAGPISGYPAATTPLSGSETVVGTQSGSTVQITTQSIANIVTAATNSWTGVQTFPAPGASHGSIVLTPGTISGTPPNGSLWTTSTGVFAEVGGTTVSLAVGNAVTQFGSVISGDCAEWITTGVIADVGTPCGSGGGGGGGSPGGANGTLQYNNSASFGGASGFIYTLSGTKLTGPDGTFWNATGLTAGANVNLGNFGILFNTTPGPWSPPCEGTSFFFGVALNYCSHATTGGTDNVGIGTIVFDHLTTGFGNTTAGSENMKNLTTGSNNSSLGFESLHVITTGTGNSALGFNGLASVTTGNLNIGIGQGTGADLDTGSSNICIANCGSLSSGNHNTIILGGPTLTSGFNNLFIGAGTGTVGYGIVAGHGNVAIGGQFTTLSDQNDSITLADGDGNILEQYLTASGFDLFKQPLELPAFASSQGLSGGGFSLGSPTIVGTGAAVGCATSHVCDSISGEVTLTTGTSVSTNGLAVTIQFNYGRAHQPACVVTSFKAASGTDIADNWNDSFTNTLTISSNANLASSTAYTIRYICGGI